MTRADLVVSMATASGWTKAAADRALRALLAAIRTSLKRGQPVTLVGFGTFSVTRRKARRGKNPRTGQPMNVAGGKTPRFRPSKELKRALR
jgi:DNA-binding protein HU-beta